jgi:hypothetical protein
MLKPSHSRKRPDPCDLVQEQPGQKAWNAETDIFIGLPRLQQAAIPGSDAATPRQLFSDPLHSTRTFILNDIIGESDHYSRAEYNNTFTEQEISSRCIFP